MGKSVPQEIVVSGEWADAEKALIAEEADRILADPAFRNSKRCQILFRYLVDRSLAGCNSGVKERTLGIEVFGRDPDYDSSADPIVRITANEIRKRLAQWYQEPAHHQQVRVRLTVGAYLLSWEFGPERTPTGLAEPLEYPLTKAEEAVEEVPAPPAAFGVSEPVESAEVSRFKVGWIWLSVAIVLGFLAVLGVRHFTMVRSKDYRIWKPLLDSSQALTLSVADAGLIVNGRTNDNDNFPNSIIADVISSRVAPTEENPKSLLATVPLIDAEAANKIGGWLAMHGKASSLRGSSDVTLQDLRQGPVVLIGGFNPWSLIMLSNLRYSFRVDPTVHEEWIQDARDPSNRQWDVKGGTDRIEIDYAIITRVLDPETGKWILAFGGIRPYGTQVAADLITEPSFVQSLPESVRSTGNMQIVIKVNVINRSAGPPQILTVYTW